MQEKLIIYLHAHDLTQPSWAVIDENHVVRQSAEYDSIQGLSTIAEGKIVWVLVPGEDILLTQVNLPKMNRSRLRQALPFALEEQLIAEVDSLHFAVGEYQNETLLPVAIVAHHKMQAWVDLLKSWNIKPDALIPAIFALPWNENTWYAALGQMALMRTDLFQGFSCESNNFSSYMTLALNNASVRPGFVQIRNYTNQPLKLAENVSVEVEEEKLSPEKMIVDFANEINKMQFINLLQANYAVKKSKLPQMDKVLRISAYLALAWVALLFLYPTVSYFILTHRVNAINNEIAEIYRHHFPQANSVIAPKMRMQERLQKMTAQYGENHSLQILGYIGQGLKHAPGVKLHQLEFQNNQLTVDLTADSSEDFSAFTDFLTHQGLSVKQQNATLSGSHVNATLQIE